MTDTNTNNEEKEKLKQDMEPAVEIDMGGELDDSKVKFIENGGKGIDDEVMIAEGVSRSSDAAFTGLGKEELMRYANDPFWKKVRMILFVLFWLGWVAMLVAAIVIIVLAPRCPPRPDLKWYNSDAVYRVYTKSFKDSTPTEDERGPGVGDIRGIESKLDYLKTIGAKALWVSGLYPTDQNSLSGNAVLDHKKVDEELGTLDDFRRLKKSSKKNGQKLIVDFIPGSTSLNHEWFTASRNGEEKYKDYYVWRPCTETKMPNNWLSVDGGSAWKFDQDRKECYLHQFREEEPDLNLANENVLAELDSVLRFWLDLGVDGFHVVGAPFLMENNTFDDEGMSGIMGVTRNDYNYLEHTLTANQPGSVALVQKWRKVVDSYSKPGKEKSLILTAPKQSVNNSVLYYGSNKNNGAQIVPVSVFPDDMGSCGTLAECINDRLTDVIQAGSWRGWMMGSPSTKRFGTRVSEQFQKAVQTIAVMLPGTFFNYYGDELGMPDGPESAESGLRYISPMSWGVKENCGFSKFKPWNSLVQNCAVYSVGSEKANFGDFSLLQSFEALIKLKGKESAQWGKTSFGIYRDVFWMTRKAEGFPGFLILANLGNEEVTQPAVTGVPKEVIHRYNSDGGETGKTYPHTHFLLKSGESHVFEYN